MNDLNELLNEVKTEKLEDIAPSFKQNMVSDDQLERIVSIVATKTGLPRKYVLVALILLFLKGAASNNTPDTLSVEVNGVNITKKDLRMAVQQILNNTYLRRVAEALAIQIGTYAEANGLSGELANRIDKVIAESNYNTGKNEAPLSSKERAWCSSFSQNIPNLQNYATERLVKYLAIDYNDRFMKKRNTPNTKNN